MAISKTKKTSQTNPEDIEKIQSEVASFASSLGLSSALPSSGFNDSDFRPQKKTQNPKTLQSAKPPQRKTPSSQKPQFEKTPKFEKSKSINNINSRKSGESNSNEFVTNNFKSFEKFKNLPKLPLVKASALGTWHVDAVELEEKVLGGGERKRLEIGNAEEWKTLVAKKKELGERLLAQYTMDYEATRGQSSDIKMLITTQRSGTAVDKVSAYSVLIGDNPIANMRSLDALLAMVSSKVGKRHALTGFEALKELFIQSLLPDHKLKTLFQRPPINQLPETKDGYSLLLFWYWEECLKLRYERFVGALEEASRDMLRILKDKALKIMYALLKSKSEQERRLLTAVVNKLGDPDSKAASNADFYLTNLLSDHPNMKIVVINEVDSFLFRPHLGMRAKYHAVNFLSQIRLNHKGDGPKVAKRLVDVYFALFKVLISEAGSGQKDNKSKETKKSTGKDNKVQESSESHVELDSRLLSALLTGVNRAFPFVSSDEADDVVDVHTRMLFQLVHSQNFNVGIQALMLIDKISSRNQVVSDRFYRALYAKLLLPAAPNTSKAEMFIGLLLRAMKNDINIKRVAAFAKRLLQVALQQPPQYACGCLFLLSEVLKARPPLWNMAIQNELVDEDLEHFEDIPDETDTLAVADTKVPQNNDEDTNNSSELNTDGNSSEEEEAPSACSSSEEESEDEDLFSRKDVEKPQKSNSTKLSDRNGNQIHESSTKHSLPGGYDPRHREPSFCNADHTSWWELTVLASHAHPSVSTMAMTLLSGANIVYNGNPLNDLSLTAFLDKFMEKKPKQSTWHGGSQIEPAKKYDMNKHLIGPEILSLAEEDVPAEDFIFHKFYMNKMGSSAKLKKKKKKAAKEVEAEELYGGDESDNEEIDNMLDATEPSLESDGEYDYDDLDKVANEDDDDLIGNVSDNETEMGISSDVPTFDDVDISDTDDFSDDDDDDIDIGDADDAIDFEDEVEEDEDDAPKPKRGKKSGKKSTASPFASLDEYEHLMNDDDAMDEEEESGEKVNVKSGKKRKSASSDDGKKAKKTERSRKPKRKKSKNLK